MHRDIKPENLLYAKPEPDETVKLADFGLAHLLTKDEILKTACGTPGYVAPEVLTGEGYVPGLGGGGWGGVGGGSLPLANPAFSRHQLRPPTTTIPFTRPGMVPRWTCGALVSSLTFCW